MKAIILSIALTICSTKAECTAPVTACTAACTTTEERLIECCRTHGYPGTTTATCTRTTTGTTAHCQTKELTPAFLVQTGTPINLTKFPIGTTPTTFLLNYTDPDYGTIISNITETHTPVVVGAPQSEITFNFNLTSYFSQLTTTHFGRNLIFGDNIPTTMNIGHDFGTLHGLVVIANMQTKGRGSGQTKWVSPRGDVYMNINLQLKDTTRAGLLPAYCALSLIKAVTTTRTGTGNYTTLPIKFSWPISLTWTPWGKKIGGVLTEQVKTNDIHQWYTTGCGLRVNSDLEYTVTKMIEEHNTKHPTDKLKQLDLPTLIARTVNYLEEYFTTLETTPEVFTKMVTDTWVNYKQKVVVNVDSEIVGLKNDGSIIFKDNTGFTGFLRPIAERFPFEGKHVIT